MPRYDYKCDAGHVQEVIHSINVAPLVKCSCGDTMKRQISAGVGYNRHQGQTEVIRSKNGKQINHWDGKQDAVVRPQLFNLKVNRERD